MQKIKVGITGQNGFIGGWLYNLLGTMPERFERVEFSREYFLNPTQLENFAKKCDCIVHLAGINRCQDMQELHDKNISLAKSLIDAAKKANDNLHIIFSSSTQETKDNLYGQSKSTCRKMFCDWAAESEKRTFTGCIIPNVFGPFCRPNYNSVVATFCHKLTHNETPEIKTDAELPLIYVGNLCKEIIKHIENRTNNGCLAIQANAHLKVSQLLDIFEGFKSQYLQNGIFPDLSDSFSVKLFNTFRSYIEPEKFFPFALKCNSDNRGVFVETVKQNGGCGQFSFSTTAQNITRGNHYHTRKIERFAVIKGRAKIELRRIGSNKTHSFVLDGKTPSFVDMPVWYTHNITNIGTEELYTLFWINEFFDPTDPDTFFEKV